MAMVDEVELGKRAKSSVDYSLGGDHCGICVHFVDEEMNGIGKCELVAGEIGEDYWCRLYKKGKVQGR